MAATQASIEERRIKSKICPAEHAYTGYVPMQEPKKMVKEKNPPILGYSGYRRGKEDMIGTTFTKGNILHKAAMPIKAQIISKPISSRGAMSDTSGYGAFDAESGYGQFMMPPSEPEQDVVPNAAFKHDEILFETYQRALIQIGGENQLDTALKVVIRNVEQRVKGRSGAQRRVKHAFEEIVKRDQVSLVQFQQVLALLSCVLSDDQVVALFGHYDQNCSGRIDRNAFIASLNL